MQDLSHISNMIKISWVNFYKSTFTAKDYAKLDRFREPDIEKFCPGSRYADDPTFRRALFKYVKSIINAYKSSRDVTFYKFLAFIGNSWKLCSSNTELRELQVQYTEYIVDLSQFNSAYKTDSMQSNGFRVTKYALRKR